MLVAGRAGSGCEDEEEEDATVEELEPPPTKKAKTEDKLPVFHQGYPKLLAA